MERYVAALDQGTTSTRFILFDKLGNPAGSAQHEHKQIYPKPGWVEHDPLEIWDKARQVINETLKKTGISGSQIAALGITNQRETTVLWNRITGKPCRNALVWQDTRTSEMVDRLAAEGGKDRFRDKTGLPLATYFSGTKIRWILDSDPELMEQAKKGSLLFGTIDSWLIWLLSGGISGGVHVTDATNASRTQLMNLHTLDWDDEILDT